MKKKKEKVKSLLAMKTSAKTGHEEKEKENKQKKNKKCKLDLKMFN